MKFVNILIFLLISAASLKVGAEQIIIKGKFKGAEGKEVRLVKTQEYVTLRWKELSSATIDDKGEFSFVIDENKVINAGLKIDHSNSTFFVEPGKEYFIEFEPLKPGNSQQKENYWLYEEFDFHLSVTNDKENLNTQVELLKEITDEFVKSQSAFIRVNYKTALDEFKSSADDIFKDVKNDFFQRYYEFHIADLYHSFGVRRPMQIFNEYFKSGKVQYDNPNYMYLLNRIFYSYIQGGNSRISYYDLRDAINNGNDFSSLKETFSKDVVFTNERIKELVIMFELSKYFDNRDFKQDNIISIVQQIKSHSTYSEHNKIAENILWDQTRLEPGFKAPEIDLETSSGKSLSLENYKGKYLVLSFIASWCNSCVAGLGPFSSMAEEYGEKAEFVAIVVDKDAEQARNFIAEVDSPVELFYFDHNYRLLERYSVTDVPQYMVIDPEGKVLVYPLNSPAAGGSGQLSRIIE